MIKILSLFAAIIFINGFFSLIPYLFPRIPTDVLLPYQIWFNTIIILILILPQSVGNFDKLFYS